jgi:hypothetical protein
MTESARIAFLIERDGLSKAREWALRTAGLYRKALLSESHYAKTREFRRKFIESYQQLKQFGLYGDKP